MILKTFYKRVLLLVNDTKSLKNVQKKQKRSEHLYILGKALATLKRI